MSYGEGRRLASALQIELGEYVADMMLNRLRRDEEPRRDLTVGQTFAKQGEDLAFAGGEISKCVRATSATRQHEVIVQQLASTTASRDCASPPNAPPSPRPEAPSLLGPPQLHQHGTKLASRAHIEAASLVSRDAASARRAFTSAATRS
jgi:hypothetical protein